MFVDVVSVNCVNNIELNMTEPDNCTTRFVVYGNVGTS